MSISKARLEKVVDAVAEALGVDTGACSEALFAKALEAAEAALTPSAPGYLTVEKDGIHARLMGDKSDKTKAVVKTWEELVAWCQEHGVDNFMCSSSLDFPEEYTKSKKIIALCDKIRNGE